MTKEDIETIRVIGIVFFGLGALALLLTYFIPERKPIVGEQIIVNGSLRIIDNELREMMKVTCGPGEWEILSQVIPSNRNASYNFYIIDKPVKKKVYPTTEPNVFLGDSYTGATTKSGVNNFNKFSFSELYTVSVWISSTHKNTFTGQLVALKINP